MQTVSYSEYTVIVPVDASYWGSNVTASHAEKIADRVSSLIQEKFPEIAINHTNMIGVGESGITGPDSDTRDMIRDWIDHNWTAAL